jgi:hypothetical protein
MFWRETAGRRKAPPAMRKIAGCVPFSGVPHFLSVMTGIWIACSREDMLLFQHVIDIHLYRIILNVISIDPDRAVHSLVFLESC